jgi:hypothetical protein
MIRHMVFFTLKPELESADRDWLFGQIRGLANLPTVRRLALGKLLDAREPWYKERIATEFGWALSMEFENEDALYAYQLDPQHATVSQEIRKRVSNVKVFDFTS